MILAQPEIRKAVAKGEIVFDPGLEEKQWGEASIDLRLGFQFTKLREAHGITVSIADGLKSVGELGFWDTKELKAKDELGNAESYDLRPGEFILALTYETVRVPKNIRAWKAAAPMPAQDLACTRPLPGFSQAGAVRLS